MRSATKASAQDSQRMAQTLFIYLQATSIHSTKLDSGLLKAQGSTLSLGPEKQAPQNSP